MAHKILLGPGRLSYPHLFEPQKQDNGDLKYSVALLLPPDYDTKPLREVLVLAFEEKFGKDPKKWPSKCRKPDDVICDAEEKYGEQFAGWVYVNASSKEAPQVVNAIREKVLEKREAYPGRWARISGAAFGYDNKTKGVTLGLNNVQLTKHDTPIAGKSRAEDDFDDFVDAEDDTF